MTNIHLRALMRPAQLVWATLPLVTRGFKRSGTSAIYDESRRILSGPGL
jgi:hypothetical protein